ncbi:hypothetical protein [Noviherbaspirillum sp. ST9]|uniref:hypothetical protein n=1 Tax=Noviherbaspirillum sp. ST9 TaxID=3401606 RepID=UPI003B58833E
MKPRHFAAAFLIACTAHAQTASVPRTPVADPRPLMIAAIDSPSGTAHGVLTGETADVMRRKFNAKTPVLIDVSTEKRYAQAGCSRLKLRFWQDDVQLPGAAGPRRQTIEFGINYCRDGRPPRSLS